MMTNSGNEYNKAWFDGLKQAEKVCKGATSSTDAYSRTKALRNAKPISNGVVDTLRCNAFLNGVQAYISHYTEQLTHGLNIAEQ